MQLPKGFSASAAGDLLRSPAARRAVLGGWLAATVVALGASLVGFRIDNSVGVWFASDDPALADYRQHLREFGNREWMLVALKHRDPGFEDRDALATHLAGLEHVHRVLSLSDFPSEHEIVRTFLKPDPEGRYEAFLLQVTNDLDAQDGYREALITQIRSLAAAFPAIEQVHIAGTAVINGELNEAARRDMLVFFPAVTLFVTLIGLGLFRNWRDTAVLLSVSMGTVIVTLGLLMGVGYPLNMITIMLPTVLIALSVADAVHLIHAFHAARPGAGDSAGAAALAVRSIMGPCAGTTLTTMAGFLAFAGSSVLPVFQLALFASFGIAFAWAITMTGAPVLLTVLWRGRRRDELPAAVLGRRILTRWSGLIGRYPGRIAAAFALGGLTLVGLTSLRADTDYVKFFRSGSRVPEDYRVLQRERFPQNPLDLVLDLPGDDPSARSSPDRLDSFTQRLATLPGVRAVLPPSAMREAPGPRPRPADDRGGRMSQHSDRVQVVVMMDYPSSRRLFALLDDVRQLAGEVLPADITVTPSGTSYLWARMDDGVIRTQKESLAVVCVVCFVLLAVLFGSIRLAALGLAFSLYPVATVLGVMGLLGIPVNMATVLIAGIAVGLAVDDTIHLVHAYQAARRDGLDPTASRDTALVDVGPRLVMTSTILVGAFAGMGLSNFVPTAQFGLLSSLTIVLALAADLTLLPAVLSWRRKTAASADLAGRSAWARLT